MMTIMMMMTTMIVRNQLDDDIKAKILTSLK